ncbi:MAG: hypothetical protein HRT95_00065 [Moritella sp.]|uniref:hypothetical protein n=1 Tax=Moritella sp. TaxID=78556 RepID=UPI001DF17A94|nr:hypothetical protein [Moritella sp.]NQZ48619.1 hypothetical protein [Moritella sp.]
MVELTNLLQECNVKIEASEAKQLLLEKDNADLVSDLKAKIEQCLTAEQDALVKKTRNEEVTKQQM